MSAMYFPHYQWAALLGISLLAFLWNWVKPRYGLAASLLMGYLSLSSLWVWVWVENRYLSVNAYDQMALRYFSVDSLARMLLLIFPMMILAEKKRSFRMSGEFLALGFAFFNSLWIIVNFLATGCKEANQCGGAGNPSIMVGASVCMLPVIVRSWKKEWPIILLVGIAAFLSTSSIALGLLSLYILYSFIRKFPQFLLFGAIVSAIPLIAGYFLFGPGTLFNSSDRFMIWSYMMQKWAAPWNLFIGTGWGTYHVFSINLQAVGKVAPGSYWNTLHNDWLQMIFEGGIVGGILSITTYFTAVFRMLDMREWSILASLVLYGIYMGVNPALHHAIPSLFGAWIFLCALKRQPNSYEGEALCVS